MGNTTEVLYATPNDAALEFVDEEIKNNTAVFPSLEVLENTEYIADVGETTQLYERIWTEIKTQKRLLLCWRTKAAVCILS